MDSLSFIESRQAHVLTYGNGYAEIQRDGGGRPVALWPLLPDQTFRRKSDDNRLYYEVQLPKGGSVYLPDYNVLHIKGLGFDGYTGYNVVAYHKEAIGYGIAVKEFGGRFFANDATPGGIYEHPGQLSEQGLSHLRDSLQFQHGGLKHSHRIRILEEGMKFNKIGVDPAQAQALEIQKYNVDDCSRIFQIPPHKLGSLDRATFSNIEDQNIDFVTQTLFYWFRKWEQECNYKLFMPGEYGRYFCEILADGLLRGNMQARARSYATGRQWGYYSINDVREKENLNSIGPSGDIYLDPVNMQPAGTLANGKVQEAFHRVIQSQWTRVIHKYVNMSSKASSINFYQEIQRYAFKVIFESALSYASLNGRKESEIRQQLIEIIEKEIRADSKLSEVDCSRLATLTVQKIGEKNDG